MLKLIISPVEMYDEKAERFFYTKQYELQLEHSLVSMSKWESKWLKPFLSDKDKTTEETLDYIKCMTLTQNVDPDAYKYITAKQVSEISAYIDHPMTATTISEPKEKVKKKIVTAEVIYYWMIAFNIPFECQKWHLNRLLTLIKVCNINNQPPKKGSPKELAAQRRALNEQRKAQYNSHG